MMIVGYGFGEVLLHERTVMRDGMRLRWEYL